MLKDRAREVVAVASESHGIETEEGECVYSKILSPLSDENIHITISIF